MATNKTVRTIEDIAKLAGVSKSTVSRALSDSPLIGEDTKERIRTIALTHNFKMHAAAQRLSRQESRTIAFVTCAYNNVIPVMDLFEMEMLGSVSTALGQRHYDLLMAHVDPHDTSWASQYLDTGRADGFILMTSTRKMTHINKLVEMRAPFIVWGVPSPRQAYCSVNGDNFNGGRLASEHLISTGRRKIAFIGGPEGEYEVRGRYEGYLEALRAAGLPADPGHIVYGDYTPASGARAMQQLLARDPEIDGVFVNSDMMAIAAMDAIRQTGRSVPDDIGVVGYDNLSITANCCQPALTTISQNLPLAGRLLGENLIQYLQKNVVTNVTIPVELVVRKST